MNDKTYNGWKNYETWTVKLWLDDEETSYHDMREMTRETVRHTDDEPSLKPECWTQDDYRKYTLAEMLETYVGELRDGEPVAGMFADLLNAAISAVNWDEIAESLLSDWDES